MGRLSLFNPNDLAVTPRYPNLREIALSVLNFLLYVAGTVFLVWAFSANPLGGVPILFSAAAGSFFVGSATGLWSRRWLGAVLPCLLADVTLLFLVNLAIGALFPLFRENTDSVLTRFWKAAASLVSFFHLPLIVTGATMATAGWWTVRMLIARTQVGREK